VKTIALEEHYRHPGITEAVARTMGADRVLFSVDYPCSLNQEGRALLNAAPLRRIEKENISHANAERLLQLPMQ
jgi:predicted TIM-barrel fold metal-dependent hydrolase